MIESVDIFVLNKEMDDMGVKQEEELVKFYFNPKDFTGYWHIEGEITFYVGGYSFSTPYSDEKIYQFNKILEFNSKDSFIYSAQYM